MQNNYLGNDEIEIDLLDLLSVILKKWKILLFFAVVGLTAGFLYANVKNSKSVISGKDQLVALKLSMSEEEIQNVENLYQSHLVMTENINTLHDRFADLSYARDDNKFAEKTTYLISSKINGVERYIRDALLTSKDYEKLSELVFGDDEHSDYVRRNVLVKLENNEDQVSASKDSSLMSVVIMAEDAEKAGLAKNYIDEKISKISEELSAENNDVSIASLGTMECVHKKDISAFILEETNEVSAQIYNAETRYENFEANYIAKLSGNSKKYYDSLITEIPDSTGIGSKAYAKYGFIGAFLGVLIVAMIISARYVMDGTIKTADELYGVFGNDYAYNLNKDSLDLIAQDTAIKLGKEPRHVYVVNTEGADVSSELCKTLQKYANTEIHAGNPLENSGELRTLSEAYATVVLVPMKKMKRRELQRIVQYCSDYGIKILNMIAK